MDYEKIIKSSRICENQRNCNTNDFACEYGKDGCIDCFERLCDDYNQILKDIVSYGNLGTPSELAEMKAELERLKRYHVQKASENCGNCQYWGEMSGKCMSYSSSASMVSRVESDSCDWFKPKTSMNKSKETED